MFCYGKVQFELSCTTGAAQLNEIVVPVAQKSEGVGKFPRYI